MELQDRRHFIGNGMAAAMGRQATIGMPSPTQPLPGIGIAAVLSGLLWLILSGVLLAIGLTVRTIIRSRRFGPGKGTVASLAFYGGSTLLALVFVAVLIRAVA